MRFRLINSCKPLFLFRLALIAGLTVLSSSWTTCSALFVFNSCSGSVPQPQITSLSPDTIPADAESVLIVNGSGFVSQSQIMWNGRPLQTAFVNSGHLQTTITPQTFDSLGTLGNTAQISVRSQGSGPVVGCPNGGSSTILILVIN